MYNYSLCIRFAFLSSFCASRRGFIIRVQTPTKRSARDKCARVHLGTGARECERDHSCARSHTNTHTATNVPLCSFISASVISGCTCFVARFSFVLPKRTHAHICIQRSGHHGRSVGTTLPQYRHQIIFICRFDDRVRVRAGERYGRRRRLVRHILVSALL